jgi:predicted MFS family arabinose efflux permease
MFVTACVIAPAGFLMGIPFPVGLSQLDSRFPRAVRWAWALNAAASVLGSAGSIFLAIYIGLRATMLVGAALYLAAAAVQWAQRKTIPARAPASAAISL